MTNLEASAAYYLDRIEKDESAFFSLIEAPAAIVPLLESAFRTEFDAGRRAAILKVIWQRRDRSAIPVLVYALQDASPQVWKEALDGLVALGGREAISGIEAAYSRHFDSALDGSQFREFLDEALEQLQTDG